LSDARLGRHHASTPSRRSPAATPGILVGFLEGDYARSFMKDAKRYHHIIDPRTGWPATACRSVTIWAGDAFTADAVDDAVFILGPKEGLELVESLPEVGAVIGLPATDDAATGIEPSTST